MGSLNDIEITGTLTGIVMGIIVVVGTKGRSTQVRSRLVKRLGFGILGGLLAGLVAVVATLPLEGCSIVKMKNNDFIFVWGTEGVMVRMIMLCGIAGLFLGATAQGTSSVCSNRCALPRSKETQAHRQQSADGLFEGDSNAIGAVAIRRAALGFFIGALGAGIPATIIVLVFRALQGLP